MRTSLKTPIHYLAFLLFFLSYCSLSIETNLKSGVFFNFSDLFNPMMLVFYWPRFVLFLAPSLILIILSSVRMKNYEFFLKVFLIFSAPVIINIHSLSPHVIPHIGQPQQFIHLYHYIYLAKSITWIMIVSLGLVWTFKKHK